MPGALSTCIFSPSTWLMSPVTPVGARTAQERSCFMASFVSANLGHEVSGNFVVFKLDAKLRFEPNEVGHRWLFQIEFMEEDPLSDDVLSPIPPSEQFGQPDASKKRHYFIPSTPEVELSFKEEFPKHLVDTEWGKEEVYAKLQAIPVGRPEGFVAGQTRTNTTKVDV